jgi:hypothetical protein
VLGQLGKAIKVVMELELLETGVLAVAAGVLVLLELTVHLQLVLLEE